MLYGRPAGGTTASLANLVHTAVATTHPDACHIYVIDAGGLTPDTWHDTPHLGAVIGIDERGRLDRLITFLDTQLRHRRARRTTRGPGAATAEQREPALLVVIEQTGALRAVCDDLDGTQHLDRLYRVAADGAPWGIHVALAGDRPQSVPALVAATSPNRLVLHLADPYDYTLLGVRTPPTADTAGRAVTTDGLQVQLAHPGGDPPPVPARSAVAVPAARIETLTSRISLRDLPRTEPTLADGWRVTLGVGDHDLTPCGVDVLPGDHLLVAGPPRSGRTTTLHTILEQLHRTSPGRVVLLRHAARRPGPQPRRRRGLTWTRCPGDSTRGGPGRRAPPSC